MSPKRRGQSRAAALENGDGRVQLVEALQQQRTDGKVLGLLSLDSRQKPLDTTSVDGFEDAQQLFLLRWTAAAARSGTARPPATPRSRRRRCQARPPLSAHPSAKESWWSTTERCPGSGARAPASRRPGPEGHPSDLRSRLTSPRRPSRPPTQRCAGDLSAFRPPQARCPPPDFGDRCPSGAAVRDSRSPDAMSSRRDSTKIRTGRRIVSPSSTVAGNGFAAAAVAGEHWTEHLEDRRSSLIHALLEKGLRVKLNRQALLQTELALLGVILQGLLRTGVLRIALQEGAASRAQNAEELHREGSGAGRLLSFLRGGLPPGEDGAQKSQPRRRDSRCQPLGGGPHVMEHRASRVQDAQVPGNRHGPRVRLGKPDQLILLHEESVVRR
eukprot:scaffold980_cov248-Pinguiococcus_pyrenoidosus.AAC.4